MAELVVDRVAAVEHRTLVSITVSIITAPKRSLGQGNVFTSVCHSVQRGVCIQRGSASRGISIRGVCIQGVCIGGVCIPEAVYIHGIRYYGIRSTSRWYASYWNAFLLMFCKLFIGPKYLYYLSKFALCHCCQ